MSRSLRRRTLSVVSGKRFDRPDTSSDAGELVFHVFGAIAHKRGRTPGRPPLDREAVSAARKLIEGGLSPAQAAKQLNIGRATAYRIAALMRNEDYRALT